jgi:hypothetical protein
MGSRTNHRPYMLVFTDELLGQQSGSRANPRPYMPTFTDEQEQHEHVEDFVAQLVVPWNTAEAGYLPAA